VVSTHFLYGGRESVTSLEVVVRASRVVARAYDAARKGGVRKRGYVLSAARRRHLTRGRYLIRPCGLAGSRWEAAAAGVYSLALGTIAGSEILTPDDALAALGLPPLLAAIWTLSGAYAAIVSVLALALFALVLAAEASNRMTILSIGAVALLLAIAVRMYATSLAEILAARGNHRLTPAGPPTLAAADIRFNGLESLTRREIEVARLASQGYMASEIGDRLQISVRTVESHLAHVYTKLGVTSRRALIRMSARLAGQQGGESQLTEAATPAP